MKPFLQISIGISLVLLTGGFFVRSIQPAQAAPPKPEQFVEEGSNKIGKYMMNYSSVVAANGVTMYEIIVWDTETGKSTIYLYKGNTDSWEKESAQLPASPL